MYQNDLLYNASVVARVHCYRGVRQTFAGKLNSINKWPGQYYKPCRNRRLVHTTFIKQCVSRFWVRLSSICSCQRAGKRISPQMRNVRILSIDNIFNHLYMQPPCKKHPRCIETRPRPVLKGPGAGN